MAAQYTVGQVLPNGATVTQDDFVTLPDGTTVETVIATYPSGAHDREVITTPPPGGPAANRVTLQSRAAAALATNATFLAIGSPTNAQAVAQVQALTRQVNGVIRLLTDALDTTAGT